MARKRFFIDADHRIEGSPIDDFLKKAWPKVTFDTHIENNTRWRIVAEGDDHNILEFHSDFKNFANEQTGAHAVKYTISDLLDDSAGIG
jgi:hypothetical protein